MGSRKTLLAAGLRPHEAILHIVLFLTPLAIGTVHIPVVTGFCAAVIVAFGLHVAGGGVLPAWRPARALSYVLLAGGLLMLVQVFPLPGAIVALISPRSAEITAALKAHLGIAAPPSLSLDVPGTFHELYKWCAGLMVFLMAAGLDAAGRGRILRTVAWAGFTVVLVGVFQKLFGVTDILGFYKPAATVRGFFNATFVNENHLAGYLGLASCVAFGVGLDAQERPRRWLYLFIAAVTGVGVFLSLSRGGVMAFLAAQLFVLFLLLQKRSRVLQKTAWWNLVVAAVIAVAAWLAYAELAQEWSTMSTVQKLESNDKFWHFKDASHMAAVYWPAGAGRGAYGSAIDQFRSPGTDTTWTHVENEYLQIAVDMGVPYAAVFYGVLLIFCAAAFLRLRGNALAAGLLAGVYMLALHNFVDYNLELSSVAFAFLSVLGVLAAEGASGSDVSTVPRRAVLWAVLGLGALAFAGAVANMGRGVIQDSERVRAFLIKDGYRPHDREITRIIAAHRAQFFIPYICGVSLLTRSPYDPALGEKFLTHASYLNPAAYDPHLYMARLKRWRGDSDGALAEYQTVARLYPPMIPEMLAEVVRRFPGLAALARAVPEEPEPMLTLGVFLSSQGRGADAITVYRNILKLHAGHREAMVALSQALANAHQLDEAQRIAHDLVAMEPSKADGYRLLAGIELAAGRPKAAFELYKKVLSIDRLDLGALLSIAGLYRAERNFVEARRAVRNIFLVDDVDLGYRVQAHMMLAAIALDEGRHVEALSEYRRARDLSPEYAGALWGIAQTYEALLEPRKAIETYRDLLRLNSADKGAADRLKVLEESQRQALERAKESEYLRKDEK